MMPVPPGISIGSGQGTAVADAELEGLLKVAYVGGGFVDQAVGDTAFRAPTVRSRGDLLVARDSGGDLVGCVIVVLYGSPACRFAVAGEAELHLLCVSAAHRSRGIGEALVEAAMAAASAGGARRMILWTQPSMTAAQRLYARIGFERVPELDFVRGDRAFLVLARALS